MQGKGIRLSNAQFEASKRILTKIYEIADHVGDSKKLAETHGHEKAERWAPAYQFFSIDADRGWGKTTVLSFVSEMTKRMGHGGYVENNSPFSADIKRMFAAATDPNSAEPSVSLFEKRHHRFRTAFVLDPINPETFLSTDSELPDAVFDVIRDYLSDMADTSSTDVGPTYRNYRQSLYYERREAERWDRDAQIANAQANEAKRLHAAKLLNYLQEQVDPAWTYARNIGREMLSRDSVNYREFVVRKGHFSSLATRRHAMWNRLLSEFLDFVDAALLIVPLDDWDLSPHVAATVLEDLRVYFAHPRIVAVTALDFEYLEELMRMRAVRHQSHLYDAIEATSKATEVAHELRFGFAGEFESQNARRLAKLYDSIETEEKQVKEFLNKVLPKQLRFPIVGLDLVTALNVLGMETNVTTLFRAVSLSNESSADHLLLTRYPDLLNDVSPRDVISLQESLTTGIENVSDVVLLEKAWGTVWEDEKLPSGLVNVEDVEMYSEGGELSVPKIGDRAEAAIEYRFVFDALGVRGKHAFRNTKESNPLLAEMHSRLLGHGFLERLLREEGVGVKKLPLNAITLRDMELVMPPADSLMDHLDRSQRQIYHDSFLDIKANGKSAFLKELQGPLKVLQDFAYRSVDIRDDLAIGLDFLSRPHLLLPFLFHLNHQRSHVLALAAILEWPHFKGEDILADVNNLADRIALLHNHGASKQSKSGYFRYTEALFAKYIGLLYDDQAQREEAARLRLSGALDIARSVRVGSNGAERPSQPAALDTALSKSGNELLVEVERLLDKTRVPGSDIGTEADPMMDPNDMLLFCAAVHDARMCLEAYGIYVPLAKTIAETVKKLKGHSGLQRFPIFNRFAGTQVDAEEVITVLDEHAKTYVGDGSIKLSAHAKFIQRLTKVSSARAAALSEALPAAF